MRLETALRQEEERARGNARSKKASIEKEAREDTEQGEEQGTMAMESTQQKLKGCYYSCVVISVSFLGIFK